MASDVPHSVSPLDKWQQKLMPWLVILPTVLSAVFILLATLRLQNFESFTFGDQHKLLTTHLPSPSDEMDGVESQSSRNFFEKVWNRFEDLGIPYTLHWGKINFILNAERVRRMYGDAAVNQWKSRRESLLDEPTRKVFTNDFMIMCGLV